MNDKSKHISEVRSAAARQSVLIRQAKAKLKPKQTTCMIYKRDLEEVKKRYVPKGLSIADALADIISRDKV